MGDLERSLAGALASLKAFRNDAELGRRRRRALNRVDRTAEG